MDEKTVMTLLKEVRDALNSEYAPLIKPVLKSLEYLDEHVKSGHKQLAENQQNIYDALQNGIKELSSQNELLRLQLGLATTQNQLLLELLLKRHGDELSSVAVKAAAGAISDAARVSAQPLSAVVAAQRPPAAGAFL